MLGTVQTVRSQKSEEPITEDHDPKGRHSRPCTQQTFQMVNTDKLSVLMNFNYGSVQVCLHGP